MIVWGVGHGDILLSITGASNTEGKMLQIPPCTVPSSTRPDQRWIEGRKGGRREHSRVEGATKNSEERRRNEIGNADYIHKRTSVVLWWLQEKEREKRKTQIRV